MLVNLTKYEFVKKWKDSRYVLGGYILIQVLLLILSAAFFWNGNMVKVFAENSNNCEGIGVPAGIAMALYFITAVLIGVFPIAESMVRFDRDLSGKQSVFEQMLPAISWKKIVAKLITASSATILSVALAAFSIILFILLSSGFESGIADLIAGVMNRILQSPGQLILSIIYTLFCFASLYLIIFFCIAFSKSIARRSRIAAPIGIAAFALIIAALALIGSFLQRIPLVRFNLLGTEDSLTSLIFSVLVFFAALIGTSWLMENKVER